MPQTPEGALKINAKHAGISVEEYKSRVASGIFRCTGCKEWRPRTVFGNDRSRDDGRDRTCHFCRRKPDWDRSNLFKPGQPSLFKGYKHTDEAKAAVGKRNKGNKYRVGKTHTAETRAKISKIVRERTPRGAAHPNYKHGAAINHFSLRRKPEYKDWRIAVFERDRYTCQDCGDATGGNLRAHHDKRMADFPELAFDVANGVTLCHPCHELRHFKPDSIRNMRKLKRGERLWK